MGMTEASIAAATGTTRRRARRCALALGALVLLLGAAGCSASSALTATPDNALADTLAESAPVRAGLMGPSEDWHHLHQVLGYLRKDRPTRPVVIMMGGSVTRECTVNDLSWRRQIVSLGGPRVLAFNVGSTNQSFDHDIAMVRLLPDVPSLVIIGVNMGRFTWKPPSKGAAAARVYPREGSVIKPYAQHRFTVNHIMSDAAKRDLLFEWLGKRQPMFNENFRYNAGKLAELVALCRQRGFRPVILSMPLNLQIIRHVMDRQRARIAAKCELVAETYHVPYMDWVPQMDLVSGDFVDNWHLVEPGRVKWQRRLSQMTVRLLHRYGIEKVPRLSPSATPSTSTAPSS